MEMLFPPSFFTVMVHLIVHLVKDAKLGGPVQYRWMYPIERYLGKLKSYVRNKAQAEGSIAEGYMAEEALTFCLRYLNGIEIITNCIVLMMSLLLYLLMKIYCSRQSRN